MPEERTGDRETSAPEGRYPRLGSFRGIDAFRDYLRGLAPDVPCDDEILAGDASPLARPLRVGELVIGNRWCIHPMEGWDATGEGLPSELTLRRWRHFGRSGAKLIWGGEAVAVRPDGRANVHQLRIDEANLPGFEALREAVIEEHRRWFGSSDDLLLGLQLTHSGRFARPEPDGRPRPRIAYRHPLLDARVGVTSDEAILTDAEVEELIGDFVAAARRAWRVGYRFVDIKHCHGYLLHEFLGARPRPGPYGGSFENRTRLLRKIVAGVRRDAPGLEIGVRLSAFDVVPYRPDPDRSEGGRKGPGVPEPCEAPVRWGFGIDADDPTRSDLTEARKLLALLEELGVRLVNVSGGSPYYSPHVQRPALYPPSDGYRPPEDPTLGVVRQLRVVRDLQREFPRLVLVGSALSYLQEWLPHVAQAVVREGWMQTAGIGRMVLSYWDLPADCLQRGEIDRRRICRTFSDCTTAPRYGLVSGCYPLDPFYRGRPEAEEVRRVKRGT